MWGDHAFAERDNIMSETDIQLIPVHLEQKETLRNLYSLYLHDLSQYTQELQIHEDGTYHFEGFELIFRNPRLQSYLIYQGEQLQGFTTLVETKAKEEIDYIINDLFMAHKARGRGIAQSVIDQIIVAKPGRYRVYQLKENLRAISFWRNYLQTREIPYREVELEEDGDSCVMQTFQVGD